MPPSSRIRPYKDYLTPALHRRFAMATATLSMLCYAEAIWIGEWDHAVWSWFPLGPAGIRTGLIFIPGFMIFVLRISQLHAGLRTSVSGFDTFLRYAFRLQTIQTAAWYCFSAWLFSEIYIWSVPEYADLNRIKAVAKTGRPILNEKPIYLTSFLFFLAIVQTGCHLYYDYDRLDTPVTKTLPKASSTQRKGLDAGPRALLQPQLSVLAWCAAKHTLVMAVISPLIYALNLGIPWVYTFNVRSFAWSFTRGWAKILWSLPKSGALPPILPFHWTVFLRTLSSGFLLTMLWEFSNAAFLAFVAQEPLKNGRPITYESRDPNGSLLTGLKGRFLRTRVFAFWELVAIAQLFEGRRKAIYEDIDRVGGSAWSQILTVCLETIEGINLRIAEYNPQKPPGVINVYDALPPPEIPALPRLTKPLREQSNGALASSPPPKTTGARVAHTLDAFAKSRGQLSPTDQQMRRTQIGKDKDRAAIQGASPTQIQMPSSLMTMIHEWLGHVLRTSLGKPFRHEYRRVVNCVVLGTPYGDVGIIIDAIGALTRFAVCSLTEDKYGNVQRDVKLIIQSFTKTVNELEMFKQSLPDHWTDVERRRESPEVDAILYALREGLNELVTAFGDYSEDLRMSQSEMRLARQAATSGSAPPAP